MINGHTDIVAHIGFPTHAFKAPMIYNPWFEQQGINAIVVPMGCRAVDFPAVLRAVFALTNMRGALITMPHKVSTAGLVDRCMPAASIAGACNAVRRDPDGALVGDMFDGEGFVRGVLGKGFVTQGQCALIVGTGGVGSAIAASLAGAGLRDIGLFDLDAASAQALAERLRQHYPDMHVRTGVQDPAGYALVVNATPLGMNEGDALPVDVTRIDAAAFVGEVVMKKEMTDFLSAAQARGCTIQVGSDMLFEQIPAYLEFFGFGTTTPHALRTVARLHY